MATVDNDVVVGRGSYFIVFTYPLLYTFYFAFIIPYLLLYHIVLLTLN